MVASEARLGLTHFGFGELGGFPHFQACLAGCQASAANRSLCSLLAFAFVISISSPLHTRRLAQAV